MKTIFFTGEDSNKSKQVLSRRVHMSIKQDNLTWNGK